MCKDLLQVRDKYCVSRVMHIECISLHILGATLGQVYQMSRHVIAITRFFN